MIGISMQTWSDKALRNVLDGEIGTWCFGEYQDRDGRGCLATQAVGRDEAMPASAFDYLIRDGVLAMRIVTRFDHLCKRFGLPRTVRAIKARALTLLEARHPDLGEPSVREAVGAP